MDGDTMTNDMTERAFQPACRIQSILLEPNNVHDAVLPRQQWTRCFEGADALENANRHLRSMGERAAQALGDFDEAWVNVTTTFEGREETWTMRHGVSSEHRDADVLEHLLMSLIVRTGGIELYLKVPQEEAREFLHAILGEEVPLKALPTWRDDRPAIQARMLARRILQQGSVAKALQRNAPSAPENDKAAVQTPLPQDAPAAAVPTGMPEAVPAEPEMQVEPEQERGAEDEQPLPSLTEDEAQQLRSQLPQTLEDAHQLLVKQVAEGEFPHQGKLLTRLQNIRRMKVPEDLELEAARVLDLVPLIDAVQNPGPEHERARAEVRRVAQLALAKARKLKQDRQREAEKVVQAMRVEGNTYPHRRDMARLGGIYDYDGGCYHVPLEQREAVEAYGEQHGLDVAVVEVTGDKLQPMTMDQRRERRALRKDRKYQQLIQRAEKLEAEERRIHENHRRNGFDDYNFVTQPILIGHHSEKRMRRLRDRISRDLDRALMCWSEARDCREQAARLLGDQGRVRGDAERERRRKAPATRADLPERVKAGAVVVFNEDHRSGMTRREAGTEWLVVRVNAKSVTVRPRDLEPSNYTFYEAKLPFECFLGDKVRSITPGKHVTNRTPTPEGVKVGALVRVRYAHWNEDAYMLGRVVRINPKTIKVMLVNKDGTDRYAASYAKDMVTVHEESSES